MKVVCITNDSGNSVLLEMYGVYDVVEMGGVHLKYPKHEDYFLIKSNSKINNKLKERFIHYNNTQLPEIWVKRSNFITIEEYRNSKLEKLI